MVVVVLEVAAAVVVIADIVVAIGGGVVGGSVILWNNSRCLQGVDLACDESCMAAVTEIEPHGCVPDLPDASFRTTPQSPNFRSLSSLFPARRV